MTQLYGWAIKIDWLGADHTYVTSSDGGKWGCWGRDSGGKTICSGTGSSRMANCLSQTSSHAGIIYGVSGVCHQTANRILYPAGAIVSGALGYWASVMMYGTYGTAADSFLMEWELRKARCKGVSGGLGLQERAIVLKTSAKAIKELVQEDGIDDYIAKVNGLYAKKVQKMSLFALDTAEKTDFLAQELELMADYRLGTKKDSNKITALQKLQSDLLREKEDLNGALIGKDISASQYAERVNVLMMKFMEESGTQLGGEAHTKLFGMAPDTVFQIVDAKILANYHKE
jgi:hypothetical protein